MKSTKSANSQDSKVSQQCEVGEWYRPVPYFSHSSNCSHFCYSSSGLRAKPIVHFGRLAQFGDGNPFVLGVGLEDRAGAEDGGGDADGVEPGRMRAVEDADFSARAGDGGDVFEQAVRQRAIGGVRQR